MGRWPLALGFVLGFTMIALGLGVGKDSPEGWQLATQWTARAGFPLLIIAYSASSLARLWPNGLTGRLFRDRRWWGLGFAACHTAHLYALISYFNTIGEPIPPVAFYGGGAAYVLMYAMVATSFGAAQRAMGVWWKRLHTLGSHYLWLVFALAYLGRALTPETRLEGTLLFSVAVAALALRIAAWIKVRRQNRARTALAA